MPIYMKVEGIDGSVVAAARQGLQQLGVSPAGVEQVLSGAVVHNPADRAKLAGLIAEATRQNFLIKMKPVYVTS